MRDTETQEANPFSWVTEKWSVFNTSPWLHIKSTLPHSSEQSFKTSPQKEVSPQTPSDLLFSSPDPSLPVRNPHLRVGVLSLPAALGWICEQSCSHDSYQQQKLLSPGGISALTRFLKAWLFSHQQQLWKVKLKHKTLTRTQPNLKLISHSSCLSVARTSGRRGDAGDTLGHKETMPPTVHSEKEF